MALPMPVSAFLGLSLSPTVSGFNPNKAHFLKEQSQTFFQDSLNTKPSGVLVGYFLGGFALRGSSVTVQRELNQEGRRGEEEWKKKKMTKSGHNMSSVWDNENMSVALFEEWVICAACDLGIVCFAFMTTVELLSSMDR